MLWSLHYYRVCRHYLRDSVRMDTGTGTAYRNVHIIVSYIHTHARQQPMHL